MIAFDAFDEAVVVLNKNSVQQPGFVGQTVVRVANNLCSFRQSSHSSPFVSFRIVRCLVKYTKSVSVCCFPINSVS